MSILVRAFKASDLDEFDSIEPLGVKEKLSPELAAAIEKSDLAVTGVRDGKVVKCGYS